MAATKNADIAQRFLDIWGQGSLDIIKELAHPEITVKYPVIPMVIHGPRLYKRVMEGFRAAFPDSEVTVLDMVDGGEKIVLRWSFTGTHSAPILGIPASGIKTTWTGMTLYRIVDGLVLEETGEEDFLSFYKQIGIVR